MKRISLALVGAVACLLVASVGTASANYVPHIARSCHASSPNVEGRHFNAYVFGENVDSSQVQFTECGFVKRNVVNKLTSQREEYPTRIEGFKCQAYVLMATPLHVQYKCLFQGADTATQIWIKFKVTYL